MLDILCQVYVLHSVGCPLTVWCVLMEEVPNINVAQLINYFLYA